MEQQTSGRTDEQIKERTSETVEIKRTHKSKH